MEIIGIKTPLIETGDEIAEIILNSLGDESLKNNDILVIASSVVSSAMNKVKKIEEAEPRKLAKELAERSGLGENFVEIIVEEADQVLGTGDKCILTIKDGLLKINSGADRSNIPPGKVALLPENPDKVAENLRRKFEKETGKKIGVLISDSQVHPLRLGTTGQALGGSGIKMALDCRKQKDLYGRELQITFKGIGDQLASAAQLIMGEADERIPAVIIREAEVAFPSDGEPIKLSAERCVYSGFLDYEKNLKEE